MNTDARYQTLGPRFLAAVIDSLVLLPVVGLYWFIEVPGMPLAVLIPSAFLLSAASHVYNIYLHGRYGQTLGKMAAGVKVVTMDDEPIGYYRAYLRDLPYMILSVFSLIVDSSRMISAGGPVPVEEFGRNPLTDTAAVLTMIVVLADIFITIVHPMRRSPHDLVAGTVVVRTNV